MRSSITHLIFASIFVLAVAAGAASAPAEEPAPELAAYMEFRRWINSQTEEVRRGGEDLILKAYADHLKASGLSDPEAAARIELLEKGAGRQEVELWNRVLTAENPRFNTAPNDFLTRMVDGRQPGVALDVGMGQGRNAIWLAEQGWQVTGFDPADKAVALARELAASAGVEIFTEVVGSEDFDWGEERWDLVVLSYVSAREHIATIRRSLRPGGLVMLEAFHDDATAGASIGRGVVYDSNELLELFSELRILHYEDTLASADFGPGETRVVRLLAQKR